MDGRKMLFIKFVEKGTNTTLLSLVLLSRHVILCVRFIKFEFQEEC
jgi:hypothetical protein